MYSWPFLYRSRVLQFFSDLTKRKFQYPIMIKNEFALKQCFWPIQILKKKYTKLLIAWHLWVQGCSVIVSELSEVFLRDNVWIIYCLNLNNSCMSQCRVIIAVTMLSLVAVSRMWSPMPLTLHSLGSAFHFLSNKELWVKGDGSELDGSSQWSFKEFPFKDFYFILLFFSYSKSEIQSCMLLYLRDKARGWECSWLGRRDFLLPPTEAASLINNLLKQQAQSVNNILHRRQWNRICYCWKLWLHGGEPISPV